MFFYVEAQGMQGRESSGAPGFFDWFLQPFRFVTNWLFGGAPPTDHQLNHHQEKMTTTGISPLLVGHGAMYACTMMAHCNA
jgi:hypothetical protein